MFFICSISGSDGVGCQTACKPGSVQGADPSGWSFIWDARYRAPRATDPDGSPETGAPHAARRRRRPAVPIWSCSRWGLPCRSRCRHARCALTAPFHPYRSAASGVAPGAAERRFAFCGTFPRVAPAGRYPAPCFRGARTFLPPSRPAEAERGEERPSSRLAGGKLTVRRGGVNAGRYGARRAIRHRVSASSRPSTTAGR